MFGQRHFSPIEYSVSQTKPVYFCGLTPSLCIYGLLGDYYEQTRNGKPLECSRRLLPSCFSSEDTFLKVWCCFCFVCLSQMHRQLQRQTQSVLVDEGNLVKSIWGMIIRKSFEFNFRIFMLVYGEFCIYTSVLDVRKSHFVRAVVIGFSVSFVSVTTNLSCNKQKNVGVWFRLRSSWLLQILRVTCIKLFTIFIITLSTRVRIYLLEQICRKIGPRWT